MGGTVSEILLMVVIQFCLLITVMLLAWFTLNLVFSGEPKLIAMGLYGCSHKTVAMGIPLINAMYEGNPLLGMYALPLLVWHPSQVSEIEGGEKRYGRARRGVC